MKLILEAELRVNPEYELVEVSQLSADELRALGLPGEDPDYFGILRPVPGSDRTIKMVYHETAQLLTAVRTASRLPPYLDAEVQRDAGRVSHHIMQLILDGVLEIKAEHGFLSGASAQLFLQEPLEVSENSGRIATLSLQALRFAQVLPVNEPLALSAQLYFFNRDPVTPAWKRRIHDTASHAGYLGIESGGAASRFLGLDWKEIPASAKSAGWRIWHSRRRRGPAPSDKPGFKLYVSPRIQSLPHILPTIFECLAEGRAFSFKIGADLPGLTRPDKLVAYFDTFDGAHRTATLIAESAGEYEVQGVPFTSELAGNGLLSWGMDPHDDPLFEGAEAESWRLWITNRLARAVIEARRNAVPEVEPWHFALSRLRSEGVDTDTWTPLMSYERRS